MQLKLAAGVLVAAFALLVLNSASSAGEPGAKKKPDTGTIKGLILDSTGEHVSNGTKIYLKEPPANIRRSGPDGSTDGDGTFEMKDVPVGSYNLFITSQGRGNGHARVRVTKDTVTEVTIKLPEAKGAKKGYADGKKRV